MLWGPVFCSPCSRTQTQRTQTHKHTYTDTSEHMITEDPDLKNMQYVCECNVLKGILHAACSVLLQTCRGRISHAWKNRQRVFTVLRYKTKQTML